MYVYPTVLKTVDIVEQQNLFHSITFSHVWPWLIDDVSMNLSQCVHNISLFSFLCANNVILFFFYRAQRWNLQKAALSHPH